MSERPNIIPNRPGGFERGLEEASKDGYLGDWDTVEGYLRDSISRFMQGFSQDALAREAEKFSLVFQGMDPTYTTIPEFHTRPGMSLILAQRLGIDPSQNFGDMLRTLYLSMMEPLVELALKPEGEVSDQQMQDAIDQQVEFTTAILLGVVDLTHPVDVTGTV